MSCCATGFGSDWVVVELTEAGAIPYRCWELRGVSITNEQNSDGIYWLDKKSNNLIHASGSYDYVQVQGGDWDDAFANINMTQETCKIIRERKFDPETNTYK
ncbi:hypothetical protein ACFL2D_02385 [Patescibacteria group bacterium]